MRTISIAPPVQLELVPTVALVRPDVWALLPEVTQGRVLELLARLVTNSFAEAVDETGGKEVPS